MLNSTEGAEMADESKSLPLVADLEKLLGDLRGVIDDALVQLNLGEKNLKDLISPLVDKANNMVAEIKSRI
jgi:hypothetical protein